MDQKEHIATLCALGTVGAAATGFAFATDHVDSYTLRPGKRKWPGASSERSFGSTTITILPRRSVTQPASPVVPPPESSSTLATSLAVRTSSAPRLLSFHNKASSFNEIASSRDSSKSRRSVLRPRTATSRGTADKRDSGSSSGWLKRLSSYSSQATSPAPSVVQEGDVPGAVATEEPRPATSAASIPNKLVKRSVSQRAVSHDEARGHFLRRPATSHQRSEAFKEMLARPTTNGVDTTHGSHSSFAPSTQLAAVPEPQQWRPFFETRFSRKRRKSESATDAHQIRVISLPGMRKPMMILGSDLDDSQADIDIYDRPAPTNLATQLPSSTSRRSRRSLSSLRRPIRRRNFTDPAVQLSTTAAQGTFSNGTYNNGIVSLSDGAAFDPDLPPGTPQFASSPPAMGFERHQPFRPRLSTSTSDYPTTSSDADPRVFSDTESLDFQSDTAYDSIATRATNTSHAGLRDSRLETIFAARTSDELDAHQDRWDEFDSPSLEAAKASPQSRPVSIQGRRGIGIKLDDDAKSSSSFGPERLMATPPQSPGLPMEDVNMTPMPHRTEVDGFDSSPPLLPSVGPGRDYDDVGEMLEDMQLDDEFDHMPAATTAITDDWHLEPSHPRNAAMFSDGANVTDSASLIARFQEPEALASIPSSLQRPSIFNWSENQQMTNFSRPKTVHGKHGNGDRSRPPGRKGAPQLHFRSQSVPVNRETPLEENPNTAKYQTWRLGNKGVSEEWSDDFDFDDVEPMDIASPIVDDNKENFRDSVRSVKIPQAIIDRQPSVHLQFGQVQEFMALVEELKRLRTKAAELHILAGTARSLWEDAESIINLATINDEDDSTPPLAAASSPPSSDPFAELPPIHIEPTSHATSTVRTRRPTTSGRRSVSTFTTPMVHGRARGESLAHARHFLEAMHLNRPSIDISPDQADLHEPKKLPFDTQDLKDLVIRSRATTRALKEEVRKAEGLSNSPQKTSPHSSSGHNDEDHPLSEIFRVPLPEESSPCPPFRKPGLSKSHSANSYLEPTSPRSQAGPFSSPIRLATVV